MEIVFDGWWRIVQNPLKFKLSDFVPPGADSRLFFASFGLTVVTFGVYARFFDILAPFIPGGSVRDSSGLLFAIPIFLLLSGQTLFTTFLTYISVGAVNPGKKDVLKANFVASVQILLFSVLYIFFPSYGPYTYVVYFMPKESFAPFSYPLLVAWTLAVIFATALLTRRIFGLEKDPGFSFVKSLMLAATSLAVIMMMAD